MSGLEFKRITRVFYFPWYYSVHETLRLLVYDASCVDNYVPNFRKNLLPQTAFGYSECGDNKPLRTVGYHLERFQSFEIRRLVKLYVVPDVSEDLSASMFMGI
jgi:hypothetical protein